MKKTKYVRVLWKDAATEDGWTRKDEIDPAVPIIETVGILQQTTKDSIVIALSFDKENENFSSWITIPKGMIVQQKELIIKKPKKRK